MLDRFPALILVALIPTASVVAAAEHSDQSVINPPPAAHDWAALAKLPEWSGTWVPLAEDPFPLGRNEPKWKPEAARQIESEPSRSARTVADRLGNWPDFEPHAGSTQPSHCESVVPARRWRVAASSAHLAGRAAKGLALAILLGGTLALVAGLSKVGEYIIDAPMQMFRTLPVVALVPLFIIWFGIGELPKVALVTVAATFPIYLTLYSGIRGVDSKLIELGRVIGLSRGELIRHVILPGALPVALVGLRYSLGISLLILVVAEQINATSGIGYLMSDARDFMRTDVLVVGLLVYAVLGLLVDVLVRWLERRLLSWRPSFVEAAT